MSEQLTPIFHIEYFLDEIVNNNACPYDPVARAEFYLAKIAGQDVQIPEPVFRIEYYLAYLCGEAVELPEPIYRVEFYLAKACGMDVEVPDPIYRVEYWLAEMSGGSDPLITLSGSLVRFTSSASRPFVSTVASIVPQQDLHGQSSPYPSGGGKNKLVPGFINAQVLNGGAAINETTRISNIPNVSTPMSETYISAGTYTFSCSGVGFCTAMIKDSEGNVLDSWASSWNALPFTFTSTQDGYFVVCCRKADNAVLNASDYVGQLESGSSATTYAPYSNICPISGWTEVNVWDEATYDSTAQPKATIPLGSTVYGGTLTINEDGSGELTDTLWITDLGNLTWNADDNRPTVFRTYDLRGGQHPIRTANNPYAKVYCSAYKATNEHGLPLSDGELSSVPSYVGGNIIIQDPRFNGKTEAEVKTMLSGVQLVYELATPTTISLTAQQINTLVGENNVWADSGDIEVTVYGTEIVEPDLNALQSLNILLGNRYINTHEADEPTDEEALDIILGGNER